MMPKITSFHGFLNALTLRVRTQDVSTNSHGSAHYRGHCGGDLLETSAKAIVGLDGRGGRPAIANLLRAYGHQILFTPPRDKREGDLDKKEESARGYVGQESGFPLLYILQRAGVNLPDNVYQDKLPGISFSAVIDLVKAASGTGITPEAIDWLKGAIFTKIFISVDNINDAEYHENSVCREFEEDTKSYSKVAKLLDLTDCKLDHIAFCPASEKSYVELVATLCGLGGVLREVNHHNKMVRFVEFNPTNNQPLLKIEIITPTNKTPRHSPICYDHTSFVASGVREAIKQRGLVLDQEIADFSVKATIYKWLCGLVFSSNQETQDRDNGFIVDEYFDAFGRDFYGFHVEFISDEL